MMSGAPRIRHHVHFTSAKPRHASLHPTLPLVALLTKHDLNVVVFNYQDEAVILRFSIPALLAERSERAPLQANPSASVIGEGRGIDVFDIGSSFWSTASVGTKTFADTVATADKKAPMYVLKGEWVAVYTEQRVFWIPMNSADQSALMKEKQAAELLCNGRPISCGTPAWHSTTVAIGCVDGTVRCWNTVADTVSQPLAISRTGVTVVKAVALPDALGSFHLRGRSHGANPHPEQTQFCQLICGAADGSVTILVLSETDTGTQMRNLWTVRPNEGPVVSISCDHFASDQYVVHIAYSHTVHALSAKNGGEVARLKLQKKCNSAFATRLPAFVPSGQYAYVVTTEYGGAYVASPTSHKDLIDVNSISKKKDAHTYTAVPHPLDHERFVICSNAGLLTVEVQDLRPDALVARCLSEHTLLFIRGSKLWLRNVVLSNKKVVTPVDTPPVSQLSASVGGTYAALQAATTTILVNSKGNSLGQVAGGGAVWHCSKPMFATVSGAAIKVFVASASGAHETHSLPIPGGSKATAFGGHLLGVSLDGVLRFFNWDTLRPVSDSVPCPEQICWDEAGRRCAVCYPRSVYCMEADGAELKYVCTINATVEAGRWQRGTFFYDTGSCLYAAFPAVGGYDKEVVASAEVELFCRSVRACMEGVLGDDAASLDAVLQTRPAGHLTIFGVVGDLLHVGHCEGDFTLRLSPAVKWKCCAQDGLVEAALQWANRGADAFEIAEFLARRGLLAGAAAGVVSSWELASICLHLKQHERGLRALAADPPPRMHKDRLFAMLASCAVAADKDGDASDCYQLVVDACT
ncbi:hypothetical protein DIPPA_20244 [Diplonema papillatum]|nr:hypothetical protein DIPPA_20244 [Diplonema papillatum]